MVLISNLCYLKDTYARKSDWLWNPKSTPEVCRCKSEKEWRQSWSSLRIWRFLRWKFGYFWGILLRRWPAAIYSGRHWNPFRDLWSPPECLLIVCQSAQSATICLPIREARFVLTCKLIISTNIHPHLLHYTNQCLPTFCKNVAPRSLLKLAFSISVANRAISVILMVSL